MNEERHGEIIPFAAAVHAADGNFAAAEEDERRRSKTDLRHEIGKKAVPCGIRIAVPRRKRRDEPDDERDKHGQRRPDRIGDARFRERPLFEKLCFLFRHTAIIQENAKMSKEKLCFLQNLFYNKSHENH